MFVIIDINELDLTFPVLVTCYQNETSLQIDVALVLVTRHCSYTDINRNLSIRL